MRQDSVVIYAGHSRYGSGPDFDRLYSGSGNVGLGAPYLAGHVSEGRDALAGGGFDKEQQVFFFDGCNTRHFRDHLRRRLPEKAAHSLHVVGSKVTLPWSTTATDVLTFLDGLSEREPARALLARLEKNNATQGDAAPRFFYDGARR
jgi:hypothetical protein